MSLKRIDPEHFMYPKYRPIIKTMVSQEEYLVIVKFSLVLYDSLTKHDTLGNRKQRILQETYLNKLVKFHQGDYLHVF